ncbi:MAG: NADH-quinone oxidoreductase subunit NuoF [Candidatus Ranarchaeia archaeon]
MAYDAKKKRTVLICEGTGCISVNSPDVRRKLIESIKENKLDATVEVKFTGCQGFCQQGPIIVVEPEGIFYAKVQLKDVDEIVQSHLKNGTPVERLFYKDPVTNRAIPLKKDIPFYKHQTKVILRNCGRINPESIDEYIAVDGYAALRKVLTKLSPTDVIEEITRSGLRGRGGAGFPTGLKWKFCREAPGEPKYMICNADEGDPGAFMDSGTLEGDPHSVLEGLIIAAYAIGANHGYIYIRAEYPLAIKRFRKATEDARSRGFLGDNIMGSGFSFDLEIYEGAGAFVCGEETALMASIMGTRGTPRPRPPYPATHGVWGKPTTINNVKTLATVPAIINKGAKWYSSMGSEKSKGTAVFALTGKIQNSGLVEVPMGTSLRKIIFDIGGGIPNGREFKAVQTGGPSGGCLPKSMLDNPADYESLTRAGSIMGSGGMVVMDEDTCMVDVAKYFLRFTQAESCGKCTPCRNGTQIMLKMLNAISEGRGKEGDIETLEELATVIKDSSLCGLGQTAPNPVLTTIKYFRDEYEAHIKEKRCPAKYCRDLIAYEIDKDSCAGCGTCAINCPADAIIGEKNQPHMIIQEKCTTCGVCYTVCPPKYKAVRRVDKNKKEGG